MNSKNTETTTKKILASGSIMTFELEDLTLYLPEPEVMSFTLKFEELSIIESKATTITTKAKTSTSMDIMISNFSRDKAASGFGNLSPIFLGTHDSKNLYLNFRVYTLKNVSSLLVHYTFYVDK